MTDLNVTPSRKPEEIHPEIKALQDVDNAISDIIDAQETKKETLLGLEDFEASEVYDNLNSTATIFENTASAMREHELREVKLKNGSENEYEQNLHKQSERYFAGVAEGYEACARDLRQAMRDIVRRQIFTNRLVERLNSKK